MTPFSDDHLKRLKNRSDKKCWCRANNQNHCWHSDTKALLARLESAEKLIATYDEITEYISPIIVKDFEKIENAWRKAKGEVGK